eukprot:2481580-Prorocentrum_lima.AAC.1
MTSSLVGSEMCIRDSTCGARKATRCDGHYGLKPFVGVKPDVGVRYFPVSYTHLTLPTICSV